jgi:membrane associated rhomboid family serine protease
LIPVKDMLDDRGGIVATAVLLVVNAVLFGFGLYEVGFWTFLVSLLAIWLFGGALEKKLGSFGLVGVYLVALGLASLIAGVIDESAGIFLLFPPGAALGLGLVLLGLAPGAKIATLVPIPFAMGLYEVPAVVILALLTVIAVLLNGA